MSPKQVQWLLDDLCVRAGFCLTPAAQAQLRDAPPVEAGAFADAVIRAEGLDPTSISRQMHRGVCDLVLKHFQATENAEPA